MRRESSISAGVVYLDRHRRIDLFVLTAREFERFAGEGNALLREVLSHGLELL